MPALHDAAILGTGSYVPEQVLTNDELSTMVDTSDEWIVTRTGIHERRIAAPDQASSDLGIEASRHALDAARCDASEVDLVICATATPDQPAFPSTACLIQKALGMENVAAFDLGAACSGFVYGLAVANQFVATGSARRVLVIGAEVLSRIVDWTDRSTCVLFGDGAGAVVIGPSTNGSSHVLKCLLGADGQGADKLQVPLGGSRTPLTQENIGQRERFIRMHGRDVFRFSVSTLVRLCKQTVEEAGVELSDLKYIVPHQVNDRILKAASDRLEVPLERFYRNLSRYGNTSAASVPIALDEAVRREDIQRGDLILLVGFGAGYTWATTLMRW